MFADVFLFSFIIIRKHVNDFSAYGQSNNIHFSLTYANYRWEIEQQRKLIFQRMITWEYSEIFTHQFKI